MEKFVSDPNDPDAAYHEALKHLPQNRAGDVATARHGGAMLAAGIMGVGFILSGIAAFSGLPVFFPAAGFIFFLVAAYAVKLSGEVHARHIETAQEKEEREWTLKRDIERERRNYLQVRERRQLEIERNLRDEQRRQEYAESQKRRQGDLEKFVQDKTNAAKQFLAKYSIPVRNVSVVGQSKAVIEVPFHNAPVHRHIVDLAEAALGLRVSLVPVRYCDKCGVKLVGPMVNAPTCFGCHTQLGLEEPAGPVVSVPSPRPLKPEIPYPPPTLQRFFTAPQSPPTPPQPQPMVNAPIAPSQNEISDTPSPTAPAPAVGVAVDAIASGLLAQLAKEKLTQLSEETPLEEEDYRERMEFELSGVPLIQARLDQLNGKGKDHIDKSKNGKKKSSKPKKDESSPELLPPVTAEPTPPTLEVPTAPSAPEMPNGQLGDEVSSSIADELLEKQPQTPTAPSMTVDRQGSVEVGAPVLVTKGPFKDNVGAVLIVNKKKRMAKVQLKGLNTAVNLPLAFLSPSRPIEMEA